MKISREQGLTLLDVLITVSLMGILSAIAVPSYQSMHIKNRFASEVNALVGDLHFTRSESIKRGVDVVICATQNPAADRPVCSENGRWHEGWVVFVAPDPLPNPVRPDSRNDVLRIQDGFGNQDEMTDNVARAIISFDRNGFTGNARTIQLCDGGNGNSDARNRSAKGIVLSTVGRVRLATDSNGDGIVENGSGNISC